MKHAFSTIQYALIIAAITLMSACGGLKPASSVPTPNKGNSNTGKNPNTGNTGVDTMRWKTDPNVRPPIRTNTPMPNNGSTGSNNNPIPTPPTPVPTPNNNGERPAPDVKGGYSMNIILPFYTGNYSDTAKSFYSKSLYALDFYAGARLALDTLATMPANASLNVNVYDSKQDFNNLLSRYEVRNGDMLLGPIEKENLPQAIRLSNETNFPVVSPYYPSADLEGVNPNFVQVKPSLRTHCEAITRHVRSRYKAEQVVLLVRDRDNEPSRFQYFQTANDAYNRNSGGTRFAELAVDESNFDLSEYISATQTTVFIVPSWNESFINSLLRKVNGSPNKKNVVIYGMPQWMDFERNNFDYYEALKVRFSSAVYVNNDNPDVRAFKARFLQRYGKAANNDAMLGYDCALYFSDVLRKYGSKFPYYLDRENRTLLQTRFQFQPVFRAGGDNSLNNVMKIENKYVNILKYSGGNFRLEE